MQVSFKFIWLHVFSLWPKSQNGKTEIIWEGVLPFLSCYITLYNSYRFPSQANHHTSPNHYPRPYCHLLHWKTWWFVPKPYWCHHLLPVLPWEHLLAPVPTRPGLCWCLQMLQLAIRSQKTYVKIFNKIKAMLLHTIISMCFSLYTVNSISLVRLLTITYHLTLFGQSQIQTIGLLFSWSLSWASCKFCQKKE